MNSVSKVWNFDAFEVETLSGKNSLVSIANFIMEHFALAAALSISQEAS